jgi:signal transduction histidine kinase
LKSKSIQQEPIELHALLSKAVNLIQVQAETVGIRLQLEPAPAQHPGLKVFADSLQTLHVLMNLIINAIEAVSRRIPAAPGIRLAWSQSADKRYAIVELSDNGPGVPPEILEKIFERFFTTREEGFGIGLALCRDIIEQQQGTIRIANNKEGGCTVTFTLPVYAESADEP